MPSRSGDARTSAEVGFTALNISARGGQVRLQYHIRVMIPCYKEELDIVQRTVLAALDADLPAGCERTVYLCDDGKDPEKRRWAQVGSPMSKSGLCEERFFFQTL